MIDEKLQDKIIEEVEKRCGRLVRSIAPASLLELIFNEEPVRAMAAAHIALICALFKNGIIVFKEPVERRADDDANSR